MTDIDKAKFILKLLTEQRVVLSGAKEVFNYTASYQWLVNYVKQQESVKIEHPIQKVENVN